MYYILACLALICTAFIIYLLMSKKPQLESVEIPPSMPETPNIIPKGDDILTEWEGILFAALDHIYSGTPATTDQQMTHVYEQPSELAKTAMTTLVKAFDKVGTLHSSLTALDNPNINMKELGDIVTRDPLLSARVLKTVNSPLFRTATDVKSIHTAVNILGLINLKNLIAFGTMPYQLYKHHEHRRMFKEIWQHMNNTAIMASYMAKARQDLDSGSLYTAGLMHDIGKLILILLIRNPDETPMYPFNLGNEYEQLSATHLQAAKIMAEGGGIPDQLNFLVLGHHLPSLIPVTQLECNSEQAKTLTILFLANQIAKLITSEGILLEDVDMLDKLDPSYKEIISKDEARQIFLSPGLIRDVLSNVKVVQGLLN